MAQTTEQLSQVQDKLSFIQDMIDKGEYNIVITESCSLFEMAFKKIFKEAVASFEFQDRNALMEAEQKIGKGNKGVNDFGFGELVGLNRESHLLSKWATYTNKDMGLINSINFGSIVELRNSLVHKNDSKQVTCNRYDAELVFNCLRNMYATLGFMNLDSAITNSFSAPKEETPKANDGMELVNISLNRQRGIIINQMDGTRNISYKVDTINRMLSVMYEKVSELTSEEDASRILTEMGYDSGSAFGRVMNEKWELEDDLNINDKITMWCDFDSEVGWGRLVNNLNVDEEEGTITGTIDINENFLCYKRKKTEAKICVFLKGYCEGVLEELLGGAQVKLVCSGTGCPLNNALKKKCSYQVILEDQ